ncbi:glycosyltransferase [Pontibacter sp. MBLB2868]|uniref:glycosyltransferase n=1 Tax=Pontibacter sp. MBLB2868 TaxID=3451555 RepID=UPI003F755B14
MNKEYSNFEEASGITNFPKVCNRFTNVFVDTNSTYTFNQLNEKEFLLSVLDNCSTLLGHRFDNFNFFIFSSHIDSIPASAALKHTKNKILIYISDEADHSVEHLKDDYFIIFKSYLNEFSDRKGSSIFPFPLGYVNGFKADQKKLILSRKYNLFFSGNLNFNRYAFYKHFTKLAFLPDNVFLRLILKDSLRNVLLKVLGTDFTSSVTKYYVKFNDKFRSGLSIADYSTILADSKIVLCPKGYVSSQTFRLTEALSCGCIVITEKLPDNYFYTGSPIIQVQSWREGLRLAENLLSNADELKRLHAESIGWWKERLSDRGIANYMAMIIESMALQDKAETYKLYW